jgi:hypothetical protein
VHCVSLGVVEGIRHSGIANAAKVARLASTLWEQHRVLQYDLEERLLLLLALVRRGAFVLLLLLLLRGGWECVRFATDHFRVQRLKKRRCLARQRTHGEAR